MKKPYLILLSLGLLLLTPYWSQAQTTINFTGVDNGGYGKIFGDGTPELSELDIAGGFLFSIDGPDVNAQINGIMNGGFTGSAAIRIFSFVPDGVTKWAIKKTTSGDAFQFRGIYLRQIEIGGVGTGSPNGTITGYKGGTATGSVPVDFTLPNNHLHDFSANPVFHDVDEVWIEASDLFIVLDHFSHGPPFSVTDEDPAEVLGISLVGSPVSTATTVSYTVTFSKEAYNVDMSNFELTTTESATASLGSLTGASGSTTYTVTVNNIAGEGSLRLDLKPGTDIENADGTAGTAPFTGGQPHYVGSCFTETFDHGETNGATTFSGNGKTFNLTGNWTVHTESMHTGLGGSAFNLKNNGAGPYAMTVNEGVISVSGLYLYLSSMPAGLSQLPTDDGSVTIRGLRSGVEQYTFTKSSGFPTNQDTNWGYTYFNFSAEDVDDVIIDQLEISLGGGFTYLNLDNFSWCLDFVAPSGYSVTIDQDPITLLNEAAVSFTFAGAEIGTTYGYTFSSSGGGTPVTDNGTITSPNQQISGIDVSGLGEGTITLSATLTDASGNIGEAATAEVEKIYNNAPVATPPTAPSVTEDSSPVPLSGMGVTDLDGDDQTLTFTVTGGVVTLGTTGITFGGSGNGSASFTAAGSLANINAALAAATFTQTADLYGPNAGGISFTANDGNATSAPAAVTFEIIGVNDDPAITGLPASITVEEDSTTDPFDISSAVISDIDAEDGELDLILTATGGIFDVAAGTGITIAGHLSSQLTLTGNLVDLNHYISTPSNIFFRPDANLSGNNAGSVEVSISDKGNTGTGGGQIISVGTIVTHITPVNDAPTVANPIPDQNSTQDVAFSFQFAANTFADVDAGDVLTYTAELNGGGALPAWLNFDAGTRTFSGTPANGDVGSVEIDVIADDGNGGTVTDTFTLTIANVNDAPTVANPIPDQHATQDVAFSFQFAASTFADVDAGDVLTYTAELNGGGALPAWLNFDAGTRTFSGTPANSDVGSMEIDVIADDSNGGTVTDTFTLTVANVNDAPTVANPIPDQNSTQDVAFSFQFAANTFADVDAGDVLTYTAELNGGGALPAWLNFDAGTRTFSGTPANGDAGSVEIDVIADDGNGGTVTDTFTLTVANVNDAPIVANPIPDQHATQDIAFSFQFAANTFADVDVGDVLTYTAQLNGGDALPAWLNFDAGTRTFSGTPANSDVGSMEIDVIADDGNGGKVTDTFTLTIAGVNDAPTITASASISIVEDIPTALTGITFSDIDAGSSAVTATLNVGSGTLSATSSGAVTVSGSASSVVLDGSISDINAFIASGGLTFTTAENASSDVTLDITINDNGHTGDGGAKSAAVQIILDVLAVNDPPVIAAPSVQTIDQDKVLVLSSGSGNQISITDVDAGSNEIAISLTASNGLVTLASTTGLAFLAGNGTANQAMVFNGSIANINNALNGMSFVPSTGYNGPATLSLSVNDQGWTGSGGAQVASHMLRISVNSVNPVVTGVSSSSPDGLYKIGDVLAILVSFDQVVEVLGGTPSLDLETGTVGRQATYESGSGSNTLTFSYTVQSGDWSDDLDYQSTMALVSTGATIKNLHGDDAILTLPAVGSAGSLSDNNQLVVDGILPEAVVKDITLELDADGVATLLPEDLNDGSSDNLTSGGDLVFAVSQTDFDCSNIGPVEVTLTVTDEAGNESTATATVTVEDVTDPVVQTRNIIVALDADGQATITAEMVDDGSDDACGIATLGLSKTEFNSEDLGINTITLTATDHSGNESDATATVVVIAFEDGSFVYDGAAKSLSIGGELPSGVEVTYTGNGQTEVDTYTVTATVDGGDDFNDLVLTAELEITKASLVGVITFSGDSFVYDGTAKSITISGDLPEEAEATYAGNGQIEAGVYTVTATIDRGSNYEDLVLTATLEITAAPEISVTFPSDRFVYDGTQQSLAIVGALPEGVTVTYTNNGRVNVGIQTVTATIDGGNNYQDKVLTATLEITPATRTLDFQALSEKTYGDADFSAGGTASSGEGISYTSSNTTVAEITAGGLIRITGAGTATITATVPENNNYSNRPEVSQVLTVRKATQTITLNAPPEVNRDAGNIQLDVTASSGLPITLALDDPEVAALEGTALNILRVGTVRITATQPGDANHDPADPVTVTVRVIDPASDLPIRIHQAVSPNGDGINEYLIIEAIKDYPENRVHIFNRNGTVVYEASGYNNGTIAFRGIGTGQLRVPAGTYFYTAEIKVDGQWKYEKGWFVLRY